MSRDITPFGLRMPNQLKEQLASEAKRNGRSLNAEIVDRLTETVKQDIICDTYSRATKSAKEWEAHMYWLESTAKYAPSAEEMAAGERALEDERREGKQRREELKRYVDIDKLTENIVDSLRSEIISLSEHLSARKKAP